jgi:hypothetical protein
LLFGAVAHHAGVRRGGILLGIFGIGLVGHFEISRRGCACANFANAVWFHRFIDRGSGIDQTGNTSRIGAFRASTLTARNAEETAAPPPSCSRLHRIACQLIDKENFDHGEVRRPRRMIRQSVGGLAIRSCAL